jgi:hypothetical protein
MQKKIYEAGGKNILKVPVFIGLTKWNKGKKEWLMFSETSKYVYYYICKVFLDTSKRKQASVDSFQTEPAYQDY